MVVSHTCSSRCRPCRWSSSTATPVLQLIPVPIGPVVTAKVFTRCSCIRTEAVSEALTPHRLSRAVWHDFLCPVQFSSPQRNKTVRLLRRQRILPHLTTSYLNAPYLSAHASGFHTLVTLSATVDPAEKKDRSNKLGLPFLSGFGATLSHQVRLSGWLWDGVEQRPGLAATSMLSWSVGFDSHRRVRAGAVDVEIQASLLGSPDLHSAARQSCRQFTRSNTLIHHHRGAPESSLHSLLHAH